MRRGVSASRTAVATSFAADATLTSLDLFSYFFFFIPFFVRLFSALFSFGTFRSSRRFVILLTEARYDFFCFSNFLYLGVVVVAAAAASHTFAGVGAEHEKPPKPKVNKRSCRVPHVPHAVRLVLFASRFPRTVHSLLEALLRR